MAYVVPFLPYIAAGLGALGSMSQGQASAAGMEFDAAVADQDAELAEMDAAFSEGRHRRETGRLISSQSAAAGASGIELAGSPLEVMMDTAVEAEIDALNIRRKGQIDAGRLRAQASYLRQGADSAEQAGFLGAGSQLFSGFGAAGLGG